MQKQTATRPLNQSNPSMKEVSVDAPQLERDHVSGHHSAEDVQRDRANGEVVDPAAGLYGGYGGLREPDSASGVEPPVIDHGNAEFDREYLDWRDEQLRSFDADYRSWRDEGHSRFTQDFDSWRKSRDRRAASGSNADGSRAETDQPSTSSDPKGNTD